MHVLAVFDSQPLEKLRLQLILPVVVFVTFLLLYLVFHSAAEALVLIFPTIYAMSGGLLLQWLLHYNFKDALIENRPIANAQANLFDNQ